MLRVLSMLSLVLATGCDPRPPPPATWADLDASAPDGSFGPGVGGGLGGGPRPSGGSTTSPPPECGARVLVVFDRSGSMAEPWITSHALSPDDAPPRWRVASDALAVALEPLAAQVQVGAILFPTGERPEPGACAMVAPLDAQLPFQDGDAFLDAWTARWAGGGVGGSTPLDPAFLRADEALPRDDAPTAVVVLTDGMPTCSGATSAWDRAAEWNARGVRTWVVGLPGAHGEETLDRIAVAGGSDAALPVDEPGALTEALSTIVRDVIDQACP